ncbi:hypothetical protein SEA_RIKSENGUPTA_82 [Microbacterium phage RikSengupta]|nr:hypothetical protein SEA_RIKSENGUPTA_82 [Microbacterium phage RikSengupta]
MTTQYNLNFIASHPRKISDDAPDGRDLLPGLENVLEDLGMVPVSAMVFRHDDENAYKEGESKEWVENFPPGLVLAVAKLLDGFVAQVQDPDSDVDVADDWIFNTAPATAVAEAYIAHRAAQARAAREPGSEATA